MSWVTEAFIKRWRSGLHVGLAFPSCVVEVRRGNFRRAYRPWPGTPVHASIPGESRDQPWYPIFTETTAWVEIPNIIHVERQKSLDANGCQVVTFDIENVGYVGLTGLGGHDYHEIDRGYYSPWRASSVPVTRPASPWDETEWRDVLTKNANVRVWVGFGPPERDGAGEVVTSGGTEGTWVFNGFIDKVDADSDPAHLTVVARMGKLLTDQRLFGWVKSKQLKDPITFADRQKAIDAAKTVEVVNGQVIIHDGVLKNWILIDDLSDIVRVCLRWAGYTEWEIEDTGVPLTDKYVFNRTSYLIDPIKWACEQTGFVFFIADPSDGNSMGVPTFRRPSHLLRSPGQVAIEVRDTDFITGLHSEEDEEPLPYIIRVRGKEATAKDGGLNLGGDPVRRLMFMYRPPWAIPTADGDMAGIIKHATHTDPNFTTLNDCKMGCYLIAANAALMTYPATGQMPGLPLLELDDHIGVVDQATGTNSRAWVGEITETIVLDAKQPSWQTNFSGYLLDSALLAQVIAQALADDFGSTPNPVKEYGWYRPRRWRL